MIEKHTPGLLSADLGNGGNAHKLRTDDGHILARVEQITRIDTSAADARRLAACWNACDGLTEQRDELLAALKLVMACSGDIASAPDGLLEMALEDGDEETRRQANAFLVARAAIAKVKGGAA